MLQQRKKQIYKTCSGCGKEKDTRSLNIRYQDFTRTYNHRYGEKIPWKKYWIYNTENFDLCRECQKKIVIKIKNI